MAVASGKAQVTQSKAEMLGSLRVLLRNVFSGGAEAGHGVQLAREHGYVDGYMRVLLDGGVVTQRELLELVREERAAARGPATGVLSSERAA
jgi:hypothetical protein